MTTQGKRSVRKEGPPCKLEKIGRACATENEEVSVADAERCSLTIYKFWPFTYFNTKEAICSELLRIHPEYGVQYTVDQRLEQYLGSIVFGKDKDKKFRGLEFTWFRGYVEYGFLGLVYLLKRNPDTTCIVLGNLERITEKIISEENLKIRWPDVGLVWTPDIWRGDRRREVRFPGGSKRSYIRRVKDSCGFNNSKRKKKGKRFVLTLVTLISEDGTKGHANILLYDKQLKELERFDPSQVTHPCFNSEDLDQILKETYCHIDPEYKGKMIASPDVEFYLKQGLQTRQVLEIEDQHDDDPVGFCLPWTMLYAEARLTFPSMDPKLVSRHIQILAEKNNVSLTEFIRRYAETIHQMNENVLLKFAMRKEYYLQKYKDPRVPLLNLFIENLEIAQATYR